MKRKTLPSFNHELTFGVARRKRRGRGLLLLLAVVLALGAGAYRLLEQDLPFLAPFVSETAQLPPDWQAPDVAYAAPPAPPPVRKIDIEYVVRPNDTLGQILAYLGLGTGDLLALLAAPGAADSLRVLRPGERLVFALHDDALHGLRRALGEGRVLALTRDGNGFRADVVEVPIETRAVQLSGTVNAARFAGGRAIGLPAEMAQQLAGEIFAWDIDFALGVRPGDRYKVLYEQKFRDGEYLGDAGIVAAEFVNDGVRYRAVRYTSPDGAIDGYFTVEGRSVRRAFLRAPIDFARVIPVATRGDRETVLHVLPGHRGLDYPAPVGTAVRAAGDGRVRFAGSYGDFGNAVILDHGGSVSTVYAHLSGFAPHVQANRQVKQGEILGYVGFSGAATAPHLHYEYRVDGKAVDPRTVAVPPGEPIPEAYRPDFERRLEDLLAALQQRADAHATVQRSD